MHLMPHNVLSMSRIKPANNISVIYLVTELHLANQYWKTLCQIRELQYYT